MGEGIEDRVARWHALCPDPEQAPLEGMREAGLFEPVADYTTIARGKAALVARTGLLGVGGIWGGRHLVARHFLEGFGTREQQAAWLGRALSVAISEPEVGAHPKHLRTRAEPVAGGFRIRGEKAWVSNGPIADAIIVIAITEEAERRKRYSAFLVPAGTPGLSMTEMPGFHALRPSRHCRLILDGCEVPASARLGPPGEAYERMAMPFRDVEDAVGTFSVLGGFRCLLRLLAGHGERSQDRAISLGELAGLTAVYEAAASQVVAELDQGKLDGGSVALAGTRVLALEMQTRAKAHIQSYPATDQAIRILDDLTSVLGIARGPRLARLARIGESLGSPDA